MHKWVITGANGNLGRRLIKHILQSTDDQITAVVRSTAARQQVEQVLAQFPQAAVGEVRNEPRVRIVELAYTDPQALAAAAEGCTRVVHLVGVIKGNYQQAHERSCAALLQALAKHRGAQLVYLSIVGAKASSANACLASKGQAEAMLRDSAQPTCVLRVPMVLGEGDYASAALARRAAAGIGVTFRAASLDQPIYAGDVVTAIYQAATTGVSGSYDLGGPESLSRAALTQRAAGLLGRSVRTISLPLWTGMAMAGLLELFSSNPPVTRAMLEVLDHDDEIDNKAAQAALGMASLTPLDKMLKAVLG